MSYLVSPHRFQAAALASEFYPVGASNGSATTYTLNFGDEHPNRHLVASIAACDLQTTSTISAVTIGGVAATRMVGDGGVGSSLGCAQLLIAAVPTGTSGDVVITTGYVSFIIQLYRAVHLATPTAHGTNTLTPIVLTVPALGVALVTGASADGNNVPPSVTITDGMLKAYDRGRNGLGGVFGLRGIHTWKVAPAGDALSAAVPFVNSDFAAGCSLRFSYAFAAPVAFETGHWSVADALTDGELLVTISTIKNTGVTDIEYQVNGGAWVSSGVYAQGNKFPIAGLTNGTLYSIAIRPVTVSGTGAASAVQQATPTNGGVTVAHGASTWWGNNLYAGTASVVLYNGGHPSPKRVIVVGISAADDLGGSAVDISNVLINGVAATKAGSNGSPGSRLVQLWAAAVPTGGDEITVKFTTNFSTTSQAFSIYRSYGLNSHLCANVAGSSVSPAASVSINVPAGGFAIGYFRGHNANAVTWAGLATESVDTVWDGSRRLSTAHESFAAAQTGRTVSATQASGSANRLIVASWGN